MVIIMNITNSRLHGGNEPDEHEDYNGVDDDDDNYSMCW
jgi:hypothetical protein